MLSRVFRRQLGVSVRALQAQVYNMPAMSPTMTEGGIVSWKVHPGDKFSAGDVLLEVETDKATIDVEAQDDGQMALIVQDDGAKGIPVGAPIAVLAEAEDDLSTLKMPELMEAPKETAEAPKETKKETPKQSNNTEKALKTFSSGAVKANPNQTLLPSVDFILHENNIDRNTALNDIPATGPKGRLLKGDVLAYLGKISKEAPQDIAAYVKLKEHLDLTGIKPAAPIKADVANGGPSESATVSAAAPAKPKTINKLKFSFRAPLGELSSQEFQYTVGQALKLAKLIAYSTEFPEYVTAGPLGAMPLSQDAIFDELLVAAPSVERFTVDDVSIDIVDVVPARLVPVAGGDSLFDDLLAGPITTRPGRHDAEASARVSFLVTFNPKLTDSKKFVDVFAESIAEQVVASELIIEQLSE